MARNVRFTFLTRKILIFTLLSIAGWLCSTKFYKELTHLLPSMQPCGRFWIPFAVLSVPLQHYNDTGCTGLPGNKTCDGGVFPHTISDTKFTSLSPHQFWDSSIPAGYPTIQLDVDTDPQRQYTPMGSGRSPTRQPPLPMAATQGNPRRSSLLPSQLQIWGFPRLPLSG